MDFPKMDSRRANADDLAHASSIGVESGMSKQAPDGRRDLALVLGDIQEHQAIANVAKRCVPEVAVAREERRVFEAMQEGENVLVGGAGFRKVRTDLPNRHTPLTQPPDFYLRDVFVDDEHVA